MKKSKINLSELKVKSFVTDVDDHKTQTVKGGMLANSFVSCILCKRTEHPNCFNNSIVLNICE